MASEHLKKMRELANRPTRQSVALEKRNAYRIAGGAVEIQKTTIPNAVGNFFYEKSGWHTMGAVLGTVAWVATALIQHQITKPMANLMEPPVRLEDIPILE